jgi:hypothetical protein
MTAIEWLMLEKALVGYIDDEMVQQALELEKQQIIDAYRKGHIVSFLDRPYEPEQYYETIKNTTK